MNPRKMLGIAALLLALALLSAGIFPDAFHLPDLSGAESVKPAPVKVSPEANAEHSESPTKAADSPGYARYEYDEVGRLTKAIYSNGASITYTYDAAGNRTNRIVKNPNFKEVKPDQSVPKKD